MSAFAELGLWFGTLLGSQVFFGREDVYLKRVVGVQVNWSPIDYALVDETLLIVDDVAGLVVEGERSAWQGLS